jgi:hypothetical protein
VSLAQTGHWLWNLGRLEKGLEATDLTADEISPFLEQSPFGFGALQSIRHTPVM